MDDITTKNKRIEEIVEAIIGSRNIAPALKEKGYVSIKDYPARLNELVTYVNNTYVGMGFTLVKQFSELLSRLGYINAFALIKYMHNRVKISFEKNETADITEITRIPGIVASITNGTADSRCMYDFIFQKLGTAYDKSVVQIETEAKEFAANYVPPSLEFSDEEQMKLKSYVDNKYSGNFQEWKKMIVENHLAAVIKQILGILDKAEEIENKEAK